MKSLLYIFLLGAIYYNFSCNSNSDPRQAVIPITKVDSQFHSNLDSLKWLYYAYTFNGKALFKNAKGSSTFNPTECGVVVSEIRKLNNDLSIYNIEYKKDGYEFSHVYEALPIYGFMVSNNLPSPLTGGLILDSINSRVYVNKMNNRQDSAFITFLKIADTSRLDGWLLSEARRRKII